MLPYIVDPPYPFPGCVTLRVDYLHLVPGPNSANRNERRCPCPPPLLAQRAASVLQVLEEMRSQIAQQIPVLKSQVRSRKPPHAVSAG